MGKEKTVKGRRVYVTFLPDNTIVVHPSKCTGDRYRMQQDGSVHLSGKTSARELGEAILKARDDCTLPSE